MKIDEIKRKKTSSTTTASPASTKRKSSTSILCELTRLKSQQKYLQCSQIKLNPANFEEETPAANEAGNVETSSSIVSDINEIERSKTQLEEELLAYQAETHREVRNMWVFVNAIKEDVFQPERLRQFTMNVIRERIIGVNAQLERLSAKNAIELHSLQKDYEKMESETQMFLK